MLEGDRVRTAGGGIGAGDPPQRAGEESRRSYPSYGRSPPGGGLRGGQLRLWLLRLQIAPMLE